MKKQPTLSPDAKTIVLVGRPNVGKSTLFNRLAGRKLALVDDTPGVTRDWRSAPASLGHLEFMVVDTAGLEEAFDDSLEARMRRQTEQAITRADVALLIVDARAGITPLDKHFASFMRRGKTPVILVANKAEGKAQAGAIMECYELGLGDPVALSAEHGEGLADLLQALIPFFPPEPEDDEAFWDESEAAAAAAGAAEEELPPEDAILIDTDPLSDVRPLNIAIVGRPNVGKSTLMNSLLGEERVLTGPEAGMTRDAISADWIYRGQALRVVDTAGIRRRARVDEKLEKLAVDDALRVIRMAMVVVLVVEPDGILDKQDLTLARLVESEGRALVIAINKWDAVGNRSAALNRLSDKLQTSLPQLRGVPTVPISALRSQKLGVLLDTILATYAVWNKRISTGQLNRWLAGMTEVNPPPLSEGRRIKLRYITQIKARPPTFAAFVSRPVDLPDSYSRYLVNGLRDSFGLDGVPIRLYLRKGKNPYAED